VIFLKNRYWLVILLVGVLLMSACSREYLLINGGNTSGGGGGVDSDTYYMLMKSNMSVENGSGVLFRYFDDVDSDGLVYYDVIGDDDQ
jgi:hypothetical protein